MNGILREYIDTLESDISGISDNRKKLLGTLADSIRATLRNGQTAKLLFICTHNSRRSHLCQIWTVTLADHFGLKGIEAFSGGTEVTAFDHRTIEATERAGFTVENPNGENRNPRYRVYFDHDRDPLVCFSKTFDDEANPDRDFFAVMTCSDADRNCPLVPGNASRIAIPYEDPKVADGTPHEQQIYDERCRQIAVEMFYMLSLLN